MAHFGNGLAIRKATPLQWLRVNAEIGTLVNRWAERSDLVVNLGEKNSAPVPALFNPASAEIEVNTAVAFGLTEPEAIGDFTKRRTHLEFPVATGAILHEACHARFTRWSLERASEVLSDEVFQAMHILEEGRIEAFGVKHLPKNRVFLRACAMSIVLGDLEESAEKLSSVKQAARLVALTYARVTAGVLDEIDILPIVPVVEAILGEETLDELREIWTAFQAHSEHDNATMLYPLAERWIEVINRKADEAGETKEHESLDVNGTPSSDGGSGEGKGEALAEALAKALEAMRELVEIDNQSDIDDQETAENWAEQVQEREAEAKETSENREVAEKVFGGKGTSPAGSGSGSRLIEQRQPTSNERIAAVQIAKALEKAKYVERSQTEIASELPPGRLRTRALVQGAALKAKGVRSKIEPWERTVRKHTDSPELKIGVMVDISGSMGSAMQPMAVTAWAMSEATRRVDGKCAMVYYGSGVFPTLKPGQHLNEVKVYSAPDGTEKFNQGFKALDGSLGLLRGSGARLLVVVSDGHYGYEERAAAAKWVKRCYESGVAVLWISFGDRTPQGLVKEFGEVLVVDSKVSSSDVAKEIGKSAVKAINKVMAKTA